MSLDSAFTRHYIRRVIVLSEPDDPIEIVTYELTPEGQEGLTVSSSHVFDCFGIDCAPEAPFWRRWAARLTGRGASTLRAHTDSTAAG